MQTTLRMNDDLIRRAKALAAVDGQSLSFGERLKTKCFRRVPLGIRRWF